MTGQVWLTITGTQRYPDGSEETNRSRHRAEYRRGENGTHEFRYEEDEEKGEKSRASQIGIASHRITVERDGGTELVLERGMRCVCRYGTACGELRMETETSQLVCLALGEKLHAQAVYRLMPDPDYVIECRVTIKAEPVIP
ncbi:DUF1934 domain-containing protein [Lachnoclostridium sp. Marseille-P6806]|uniref:DUF1934 domain-containing protein n=1 Tax=Lachnoclostridium sp. Marseille-P6806 TaxID=2364793 RepID=UPI0010310E02|nr:DUF1934 domain-containing protein [Lachnoclostridium sp. Marseille-P6806]